jgi:hypothetical protein
MAQNYYDTAMRMYKSSKHLHSNTEFHCSCYLAGYVVESYAKILVGMSYQFGYEDLKQNFLHDLKRLNKELLYILNHSSVQQYINDLHLLCPTIAKGHRKWHPNARYNESNSEWLQNDSEKYQEEIKAVMQVLTRMKLNFTNLI